MIQLFVKRTKGVMIKLTVWRMPSSWPWASSTRRAMHRTFPDMVFCLKLALAKTRQNLLLQLSTHHVICANAIGYKKFNYFKNNRTKLPGWSMSSSWSWASSICRAMHRRFPDMAKVAFSIPSSAACSANGNINTFRCQITKNLNR